MENLNEDIKRLRQIMSYDRSRGLLVNESQYSMDDDNGKEHVPFQGYKEFGDGKPLSDDERSRAEEIANEVYKTTRASFPDSMKPMDLSDIKTDAFYDHVMNTLGKLYNQEESVDNTEIYEQKIVKAVEDDKSEDYEISKSIAKQIYSAVKGMGTDEGRFLDAVKDINSINMFSRVDNLLKVTNYGSDDEGFEYFVNDEFGTGDVDVVESIVRHLKSIGIESSYKTIGRSEFREGSFKIETSLTPPKKGADDTPKDSDKYNDDGTPKEPNTEEPNTEDKRCPTEEDILSGKVLLRKGAMGDVQCDVVEKIQKILIKKMGESGVTVSIGEKDYGYYGPKTVSLVFAYQSLKGLKEDGIVGKNTMKSILS